MMISGSGEMWNFWQDEIERYDKPWADYTGSIESLIIEEGVTYISESAFSSFNELYSIHLPNSLIEIGDNAFWGCSGLTTVVIPKFVRYIGNNPFAGCSGLSSIIVDSDNTFYSSRDDCNAIIEISTNTLIVGCKNTVIPNSVASIGFQAFAHCEELTSMDIPNSVISIDADAFSCCYQLTSITIPGTVTTIGNSAFEYCYGLTTVSIPNGMISIGRKAFEGCNRLTAVTIPESVSSLGENLFSSCSSLSSITVDANNNIYDSRNNCNAIIEKSTNTLLFGCLNTIIPSDVTSIEKSAFSGYWALKSIIIPNSVTTIGNYAFYGCNGLTSITTEISEPASIERYTFFNVNKSTCTLYVPKGSKTAYENAEYWNEFENIVEIDDDPDTDISEYDNIVYIDGTEAVVGQRVRLSLNMNNTIVPTAFQCDVYLPDGVTAAWELDEDGNRSYLMGVNEGRTTTQRHALQSAEQPDGCLRILCNSVMNYSISGNEGEVAYLMVDIDPDMEEGTYPLILRNIEVTDANLNAVIVDYVKTSLTIVTHAPGDANGDSRVSVSDLTAIANHILGRTYASFDEKAADVNVDGRISVSDLTGVANIILYGTVSPHASNAKERGDSELVNVNIDANDVSATMGEEFTAAVNISGNYAYSGYQFDVTLPEGITVKDVGGQTTGSDLFMSGMIDDNTLRVLCASTTGETTESSVVYLTFVAESAGPYSIDIDNAIVSANASSFAIYESSFLVDIDSNATGISTLCDEAAGNASVYDLTGKMWNGDMSKLPKGIYIINGNKFSK